MKLVIQNQWKLLLKLKSFWLTSLVSILDNVGTVILAYIMIINYDVTVFTKVMAIEFGTELVSLGLAYGCSHFRWVPCMLKPCFHFQQFAQVIHTNRL